MGQPILMLEGIAVRYGAVQALKDVNLAVQEGEVMCLLGPSGSGKSTILHLVAGIVTPTAGSVVLQSREITRVPIQERELGMVFQGYALFPHLSVFGNIAFPLTTKQHKEGPSEIKQAVREMLDLVRLEGVEQRRPHELSGGQRQRVALARALVYRPKVLLLDEPLGALDRLLREEMQDELRQIQSSLGTTMIYVTHDQDEAMVVADRIAILRMGHLEQVGSPRDLYEHPKNDFVARFFGGANLCMGILTAGANSIGTIRVGDTELRAQCGPDLQVGDEACYVTRCEDCSTTRDKLIGETYGVRGEVRDVTFTGGGHRLVLATELGVSWTVILPPEDMMTEPRKGDLLAVHWRVRDAKILKRTLSAGD